MNINQYKRLLELCADNPENRFAISRLPKSVVKNALKWRWIIKNNDSNYAISEKGVYQLERGVNLPKIVKMRSPTMNEAVVLYALASVGWAWEPKKRYEHAVKSCFDNGWLTAFPVSVTAYGYQALERVKKPQPDWNEETMHRLVTSSASAVKRFLHLPREALLKKRAYVIFSCDDLLAGPCYGIQLVVRYNSRRIGRVQKWRFGLPIGRWIYIDGVNRTLRWVARQIERMGPNNEWSIYMAERRG